MDTELANRFFLLLTLAADVAVFAGAVLAAASVLFTGARCALVGLVGQVGPHARLLAALVAGVATAGSLYYSEIANLTPCALCWYQRICMYPLVVVLGVGCLRPSAPTRLTAAPFVVAGIAVAGYHWLVERYPSLGSGLSCSLDAPCTVPWFEELGFITLAWMSLSAFGLVATLLLVDRAFERLVIEETA